MRHILIDTDTASDDAVALLMALREPEIKVEAITVVAGNCPLETCVKNALISVEMAGTYTPPVYAGMKKPILRELYSSEIVHGNDGMGNMNLPEPLLQKHSEHAVDMIIELAYKFPGELEIITIGPLTNIAVALLKEPELSKLVKHVYIMGGAGLGPGNITPVAEFNFFVDAEAVHIVLESDLAKTVVGWDVCMDKTFINQDDIIHLNSLGKLGQFTVRCNKTLIDFNKKFNKNGFDLPDPATVASALYPEIVIKKFDAYTYMEFKSEKTYGQFIIDQLQLTNMQPNVTLVTKIDAKKFKEKLFQLLS